MDATIQGNIETVLTTLWTYFFGSTPATMNYSNGVGATVQTALLMGYAGAAFAFFISVAGAFNAGAEVIKQVEDSFF